MLADGESQLYIERRHVDRVSSAFWPVQMHKGVATNSAAQRRRTWIMQGRWWMFLVDGLSLRVLRIIMHLLVISISLLVAVLGLSFGYLLLLPLFLFALLLIGPRWLTNRPALEAVPPVPFAQDMRSSAGFLSQRAYERSSFAESAYELNSEPGVLTGDAPLTPMSIETPLVRVLETYDLRPTPTKHFLTHFPDDTAEQTKLRSITQDFWGDAVSELLRRQGRELPCSHEGSAATTRDVPGPRNVSVRQDNGYPFS